MKDELEETLGFSGVSSEYLQKETIDQRVIEAFWKLASERRETDGYYMLILGCAWPQFWGFGSFLGFVVGLNEDDNLFWIL